MEKLSGSSVEPSHRVLSLEQEQRGGHFPLGGLQATPAPAPANSNNRMPAPPMPPAPAQAPTDPSPPNPDRYIFVGCSSTLLLAMLSCGCLALFSLPVPSLGTPCIWSVGFSVTSFLSLSFYYSISHPCNLLSISVFVSLCL